MLICKNFAAVRSFIYLEGSPPPSDAPPQESKGENAPKTKEQPVEDTGTRTADEGKALMGAARDRLAALVAAPPPEGTIKPAETPSDAAPSLSEAEVIVKARAEALEHDQEGTRLLAAGHFAAAATAFHKANELAPRPALSLAMGNAYEKAGYMPAAIRNLREYVKSDPTDAKEVQERINILEAAAHPKGPEVAAEERGRAIEQLRLETAKTHYEAGKTKYKAAHYKEAYEEFKKANELDPRPALQYNMARSVEQAGETALALNLYRKYLKDVPDATDAKQIGRIITALTEKAAAEYAGVPMEELPPVPPEVNDSSLFMWNRKVYEEVSSSRRSDGSFLVVYKDASGGLPKELTTGPGVSAATEFKNHAGKPTPEAAAQFKDARASAEMTAVQEEANVKHPELFSTAKKLAVPGDTQTLFYGSSGDILLGRFDKDLTVGILGQTENLLRVVTADGTVRCIDKKPEYLEQLKAPKKPS